MPDSGNEAQVRIMLDNVAQAAAANAILQYKAQQLGTPEAKIPPPLKWLGAAAMAVVMLVFVGVSGWLVTTVDDMQETLARMDERQLAYSETQDNRFADFDRRITKLETDRPDGGAK